MVWFFERSGEFIRCETREDDTGRWELVVVEASGAERVERFENGDELEDHIRRLHHGFQVSGWFGPHGHFI